MKTIFHRILTTTALCLAAVVVSSCSVPQAIAAENTVPECYLTYSDDFPPSAEPPPVLRLNEQECRELLAIEAETEPDTPMYHWQICGGSPVFCIYPNGEKERLLFALSKVKHLTHTYIPESAAKRFDALVKTVESRPDSQLSRAEVQRWYKQYRPIRYRFYYKD
ncbi:MAG: hypothetical protein IJN29_12375 [Akkermansia sp.]|nr:hypothetical protein [Akkermansia sp.]